MYKSFIYVVLIALGVISTAAIEFSENCDSRALKAELKVKLEPNFKYDSSTISRFVYQNKKQVKEIEIPLYIADKYQFSFNTDGLPKDVKIEIYDKKVGEEKRKRVYLLEQKDAQHVYTFELKRMKKAYINYTISATDEEDLRGCAVFLLGYKMKH